MAPIILSGEAMKLNIPAWKRLGLKLKSAQQESAPYSTPVIVTPVATTPKNEKRKREIKDQKIPPGKRVRVDKPPKAHEPKADTTPNQSPITSAKTRRKSVTFTPETKTEDGDSIKELYNGWIAKHPAQSPKFHDLRSKSSSQDSEPTRTAEKIDSAIDEILQEVEATNQPKKLKKPKQAKLSKSERVVKSTKQLDPALSYLQLFHSSRETWKFNKIHQITLLKNAFDVEKISSQYIEILYTYISGLKGSARTHLRDAAIAIKVKAQEEAANDFGGDMSSATTITETGGLHEADISIKAPDSVTKVGYEESVLQPLSDHTIKQRIAKRMRAERILDELAQEAQEPGKEENGSPVSKDLEEDRDSQKRLKMSDGSTQKIRRKRKQRTNAVNDSSSSDSTDTDSSSEEEDEEIPDPAEDESSSSSSSSSSTSEDEDDSQDSESGSGSGSYESD